MTNPMIGYAGMTHLGLNSAAAAADRGFEVICYDADTLLVTALDHGELPVTEPDLPELLQKNTHRIKFTAEAHALIACDLVYIAMDVSTDDYGLSDLEPIIELINLMDALLRPATVMVILSQVPPGFTRALLSPGRLLHYQVETLIFGRAVERACFPERYIVGCADPGEPLPPALAHFLGSFGCPILPMRYESAELAKISINMCLVASVSVANTLAEICERIGADWAEIVPALRLDRRIGQYAYLSPGLGISGGNLERDLATVLRVADQHTTDGGVVSAFVANSRHRKDWAWAMLNELVLRGNPAARIAVWGLTYKENTNSLKNSQSIALIEKLINHDVTAFDPKAAVDAARPNVKRAESTLAAADNADVLLILTPWPEFRAITADDLAERMRCRIVIDPYGVLNGKALIAQGFTYATLGVPAHRVGST